MVVIDELFNMSFVRGDTVKLSFEFTDPDTGNAIDLTGATVSVTVKETCDTDPTDASAVMKKDQTTHTAPTGGKTEVEFSPSESKVDSGLYKYDVQILLASGEIYTPDELPANCTIKKEVTVRSI